MVSPAYSKKKTQRLRWVFFLRVQSAFVVLGAVFALLSVGCANSSREAREEFARLSHAIDGLRNAENAHKAQMIQPLRAAECRHFCALRDQCVAAYETHIRALDAIERARLGARLGGRDLDGHDLAVEDHTSQELAALSRTARQRAAGELDAAELMLEKAKQLATECAVAQAELGR